MCHEVGQEKPLPLNCLTAKVDTTVEELIPLCMGSEFPVAIQDFDGKTIGRVDRQSLMVVLTTNGE